MKAAYLSFFLIFVFSWFNLFGINPALAVNQLFFLLVSGLLFFLVKKIGRDFFLEKYWFFYLVLVFFLILVFFFGDSVRGAKRWINFGFFNFQPSEFLKIFLIISLAQLFSSSDSFVSPRWLFSTSLLIMLFPFILIYKQPDLGTAIVTLIIFLLMSFFSPIPKKYFFRLFILFLLISPLIWHFLADYQKTRLIAFINPHLNSQGTAYNMIQAIITIGSGGFFGKGLGLGTQSKLYFLPENHTDFAFASLIEQFGFLGGLVLLILYLIFILSLFKVIYQFLIDKKNFDFYYLLGLSIMIFSQMLINMGMNLGIAPITGIPLPIISYGGSSLTALLFGLSLINIPKKSQL